jgi:hypothetical protein
MIFTINKLIKCYVSQQKGFIRYINKSEIDKEYNFYKVITARAAHEHKSGFGNMFIGDVNEIHTGSYISFKVGTKQKAESLLSYLKCKLPHFMLSLRKISQDISESTCKWIPLPPLNKIWTDNDVYKYFKLSNNEINMITSMAITGYKENLTQCAITCNPFKEYNKLMKVLNKPEIICEDNIEKLNNKFNKIESEFNSLIGNNIIIVRPKKKKQIVKDIFDE